MGGVSCIVLITTNRKKTLTNVQTQLKMLQLPYYLRSVTSLYDVVYVSVYWQNLATAFLEPLMVQ